MYHPLTGVLLTRGLTPQICTCFVSSIKISVLFDCFLCLGLPAEKQPTGFRNVFFVCLPMVMVMIILQFLGVIFPPCPVYHMIITLIYKCHS